MEFIKTNNPNEKDIIEIRNKLIDFNLSHIELKETSPIAIFVHNEAGEKIAGISGETHGNWLEISFL
ncbi:hypothetical protein [Solibacillus cecembensis]|uniref:hypothetical protein n=1 Tax=Solibacillus cecembensis TaxID=459347 RepID=UPI003D014823